jgi:hypothetical protein
MALIDPSRAPTSMSRSGWVAERLKAPVLKFDRRRAEPYRGSSEGSELPHVSRSANVRDLIPCRGVSSSWVANSIAAFGSCSPVVRPRCAAPLAFRAPAGQPAGGHCRAGPVRALTTPVPFADRSSVTRFRAGRNERATYSMRRSGTAGRGEQAGAGCQCARSARPMHSRLADALPGGSTVQQNRQPEPASGLNN